MINKGLYFLKVQDQENKFQLVCWKSKALYNHVYFNHVHEKKEQEEEREKINQFMSIWALNEKDPILLYMFILPRHVI